MAAGQRNEQESGFISWLWSPAAKKKEPGSSVSISYINHRTDRRFSDHIYVENNPLSGAVPAPMKGTCYGSGKGFRMPRKPLAWTIRNVGFDPALLY